MATKLIGVVGESGSGKDTVASLLPGYLRLAFGDELRNVCRLLRVEGPDAALKYLYILSDEIDAGHRRDLEMFRGIPRDEKDGPLLQELGTWARKIDDGIWIRPVVNRVKALPKNPIIITDIRRPSEFEALKENGFTMIYVDCPWETRNARIIARDGANNRDPNHECERQIRDLRGLCDLELDNSKDYDHLMIQIQEKLLGAKKAA